MSQYLEGQIHQLAESLQAHEFTPAEVTALGQNSNGILSQIKLVLMGLATIVRLCFKLVLDKAFNPSDFIGSEWRVWKGPVDGTGLEGEEEYVQEPDIVDFGQIVLETHLQGDETSIHGEEKMRHARVSKNRQLGGRAFLALWNDWKACRAAGKPQESLLEKLRIAKKIGNVIYFFGLTLRDPNGSRNVLYLYFIGREWYWYDNWLNNHWDADDPSVALASVKTQS